MVGGARGNLSRLFPVGLDVGAVTAPEDKDCGASRVDPVWPAPASETRPEAFLSSGSVVAAASTPPVTTGMFAASAREGFMSSVDDPGRYLREGDDGGGGGGVGVRVVTAAPAVGMLRKASKP